MQKRILHLTSLIISIVFTLISPPDSHAKTPQIKVKIAEGHKYVDVVGNGLKRTLLQSNETKYFSGNRKIRFNCYKLKGVDKKRKFDKRNVPIARISSRKGILKLNKVYYKGEVIIVGDTTKNRCYVINVLNIDDYLSTLLSKEMKSTWPIEALKAQAVAARTYALFMIKSKRAKKQKGEDIYYDIESSEKHQVSGNLKDSTKSTLKASRSTRGETLFNKKNKLSPAFYHAKCGGKTLVPSQVWSNRVVGYSSVPDPFCKKIGIKPWKAQITVKEVKRFLNWLRDQKLVNFIQSPKKIKFMSDGFTPNQVKVYLGNKSFMLKKSIFRRFFGRKSFLSNNFSIEISNNLVHINGKGHGHGVGLCQWGALEMANQGFSYKKILAYYYPGLNISKIY